MTSITISELDTLGQIENALREVQAGIGRPLQVNKDSINKRKGALHDASRLQLLTTWARTLEAPYLHFHPSNKPDAVVSELCTYAPGISVLRLAEGIKVGDETISRRTAIAGAAKKMEDTDAMRLADVIKGRAIDMTCVSGAKVQYLRPLFHSRKSDAVKDSAGFYMLFKALNEQINQRDSGLVPDRFLRASAYFTDELFSNTQEHALRDHVDIPYTSHVEGLIFSWDQLGEEEFYSDFEGHARLKEFWDAEAVPARNGSTKAIRCFQLSFFDTGPGFASRASGKAIEEMELKEERTELLKCLQKNFTTKSQTGAGSGIPNVLSELQSLGGLIRIRSGRHSVFNVFSVGQPSSLFDFSDWTTEPLAPVAGAVITLIVPLRKEQ